MFIKLNADNIVEHVVFPIQGVDASLLQGFIQVDDEEDVLGKVYNTATSEYTDAPETAESIRAKRNSLLVSYVDPIVSNSLRWADMTISEQNAWSQYRTDLLNITDQSGFPTNVTWPTKPQE